MVAAPIERPPAGEPSFDALTTVEEWTAELALKMLPETNGPRVEVFNGSVIVAPHAGFYHQAIERELSYALHRAARTVGLWALPEINLVSGKDLFIPDVAVLRNAEDDKSSAPIEDAVMLVEIVSKGNRRKDLIDRPNAYAAAGVPWFMRVDARNGIPSMTLHRLEEGDYLPVVAAAAGTKFAMTEPLPFAIDPGDLLAN